MSCDTHVVDCLNTNPCASNKANSLEIRVCFLRLKKLRMEEVVWKKGKISPNPPKLIWTKWAENLIYPTYDPRSRSLMSSQPCETVPIFSAYSLFLSSR